MNTQGLNKSVLALLMASSATGAHAAPTIPSVAKTSAPARAATSLPQIHRYELTLPARYQHETQGYIEGKILLNLTTSSFTPPYLNQVTAEYEGEFYFISHQKIGKTRWFESLGGEDGKIILDLVNNPSQEHNQLPATYNVHSCSSTLSMCSPMALQVNVYRNNQISLNGSLKDSKVEILNQGQWTQSLSGIKVQPLSSHQSHQ